MNSVSVIIPCYNQGNYLEDALFSLNRQLIEDIEVIVVNDGSTDLVYEPLINRFRDTFPALSILLIEQENQGLSAARNIGIMASTGEYICLLDADDLLVPESLSQHLASLQNSGADISLSDYVLCNDDRSAFWVPETDTIGKYEFSFSNIARFWERGYSIPIHCALFTKRVFDSSNFHSGLQAKEDWIFWLGVAENGHRATFTNFKGAVYRQHSHAMTKDLKKMGVQWLRALDVAESLYPHSFVEKYKLEGVEHFMSFYFRHFWSSYGYELPVRFFSALWL